MSEASAEKSRVVIVGGGVAGLETLLALHDLAGERAQITLVAPQPDFVYKPLLVEEPFGLDPAERHELAPLAAEKDARFVQRAVNAVDPKSHEVELDDGSKLSYDYLVVCAGGRYRPALEGATTFPSADKPFRADEVIDRAASKHNRIALIIPGGVTWALPMYEIALMTQRRAVERNVDVRMAIVTPEDSPLGIFGSAPSTALSDLLRARGIQLFLGSTVREIGKTGITLTPRDRVPPSEAIALPVIEGPAIEGLPKDGSGFIPVDDHSRVKGVEGVYAAGDGTNFPIKQGGLGTQQADAAAEDIAHRLGATATAEPFRPVLRGKLLTGEESISMRADVAGGGGEGEVALDGLWWPPHKISARYLAPLLYHDEMRVEGEPPRAAVDIELALPSEWHVDPDALDPSHPSDPG